MKQALKILCLIFLLSLVSCSSVSSLYYDVPPELNSLEKLSAFIEVYSPYIKNKMIFIDPGHGGEDRKNRGYQGLAIEADVNLSVSLELKKLFILAGAVVQMSRELDETVPLKLRSEMANKSGADIFISIHHNAPPLEGDDYTNYTSTYFHSLAENYNYEPCERDIAKFIQRDLAYAMRNSGGPGSFDGTYSDYSVYPGDGFSVLRLTEIPAVLVECGFHTHKIQEQKLADEFFNKIEAWGIFKGLCRYFKAGIPEIKFRSRSENDSTVTETFFISDSSGIDINSIKVYTDSVKSEFGYDTLTNVLSVDLKKEKKYSELRIIAANKNGNHSFPFTRKLY
ncbi:MAG: N-acetylmuramoyl-L-alanine amidase [Ignavibacteriales bacterium]|nr:MAG: N-acetylmuramoyl-L-alanine amidase [Ignavibacteriales bacterium]